ncbi:MAG: PhnD/SsuA/transferrin family substrate-binding protein [Clostridia bacterium]|nr:PhnD/SsuA/transferrin family substrate-binding protein [Clostridia bacterium]
MKKLIKLASVVMAVIMMFTLCACGGETPTDTSKEKAKVKIATLSGPTGMGMAKMMSNPSTDLADYQFTVEGDPQTLAAAMINQQYDICALPVNVASTLYNKTNGKVKIAAVNTLGNIYVVSSDKNIKSFEDLKGKKIISAGQGATPEYVFKYILGKLSIEEAVCEKLEYKTEHDEVSALLVSGEATIGILPEPAATAAIAKNPNLSRVIDLNAEWDKIHNNEYPLAQGCIVVSSDFAETNKEVLDEFLANYKNSVDFTNNNTQEAATLIEQNKIFKSAKIASKSIPLARICYMDGAEMKKSVHNVLNVLWHANSKSVGGALPDDNFYYAK